jgi:hypothetical protein
MGLGMPQVERLHTPVKQALGLSLGVSDAFV